MAGRRGRLLAVLLVLVGAGLVLLAGSQGWVTAAVQGVSGRREVTAPGSDAAPGVPALALVSAAAAVVLLTGGRVVRLLTGAVLVLAGLGVVALVAGVAGAPAAAAGGAVTRATGSRALPPADSVTLAPWPWLAALGGLAVALGGAAALARGRTWPGPTRRYERPLSDAAQQTPADDEQPAAAADTWDALSRGEDPTVREEPATNPRASGE